MCPSQTPCCRDQSAQGTPPTHTYFLESMNETLPALGSSVPEQLSSFRSSGHRAVFPTDMGAPCDPVVSQDPKELLDAPHTATQADLSFLTNLELSQHNC